MIRAGFSLLDPALTRSAAQRAARIFSSTMAAADDKET